MILAFLRLAALSVAIGRSQPAHICDVVSESPAPPRSEPIRQLVADASAIVRVRVASPQASGGGSPAGDVRLEVLGVMKSDSARGFPATLSVRGHLVDRDDYNPLSVPYAQVRPAGLRGSCFAQEYRVGGEYLLLLTRGDDGQLTPYWAPLMPTTEQVRGADDPWVEWVSRQIATDKRRSPSDDPSYGSAARDQIFLCLEGSGWVASADGTRTTIRRGDAAFFSRGELHAKGSAYGLRALIVQVDELQVRTSDT